MLLLVNLMKTPESISPSVKEGRKRYLAASTSFTMFPSRILSMVYKPVICRTSRLIKYHATDVYTVQANRRTTTESKNPFSQNLTRFLFNATKQITQDTKPTGNDHMKT